MQTAPIGGPLLDRVVYWAKAQGMSHELRIRARTLHRLHEALTEGMSYAQACELMDRIEAEAAKA